MAALVARTMALAAAARPASRLMLAGTLRMSARPPAGLARVAAAARPATVPTMIRGYCSASPVSPEAPASLQPGERHIYEKLRTTLTPTQLYVEDISGTFFDPPDTAATATRNYSVVFACLGSCVTLA